jgi:hypothetical protein
MPNNAIGFIKIAFALTLGAFAPESNRLQEARRQSFSLQVELDRDDLPSSIAVYAKVFSASSYEQIVDGGCHRVCALKDTFRITFVPVIRRKIGVSPISNSVRRAGGENRTRGE